MQIQDPVKFYRRSFADDLFCFIVDGFKMNFFSFGDFNIRVGKKGNCGIEDGAAIKITVWTDVRAAAGQPYPQGCFTSVCHGISQEVYLQGFSRNIFSSRCEDEE